MIVQCLSCHQFFDDEFRNMTCPHEAFLANDGQNNFKIYEEAWLCSEPPTFKNQMDYEQWLNKNKVKVNAE